MSPARESRRSGESYLAGSGRDTVRAGMTLDLELPALTVRTDDGYDPGLDQIIDWVIDQTREGRRVVG